MPAFGSGNRFGSIRSVDSIMDFFGNEDALWEIDEDGNFHTTGGIILGDPATIRGDWGGNGIVGVTIVVSDLLVAGGDGGAIDFGAADSGGAGFRMVRVPNA